MMNQSKHQLRAKLAHIRQKLNNPNLAPCEVAELHRIYRESHAEVSMVSRDPSKENAIKRRKAENNRHADRKKW